MSPAEYTRQHARKSFEGNHEIPVTVIQFGKLHRQDITVQGVDVSDSGLGIQSEIPIAPGFIWFWRPIGSQKGGMIVWSRKIDGQYRAGIRFLPIPMSPHDYLRQAD